MRREGRQHGMVRTLPVLSAQYNPPPSHRRTLNEIAARPTAGSFTRAPTKPTNHSKFTGKCSLPRCRDCHRYPACKAKDKTKGTHKVRSPLSSELREKPSGFSATGMMDYFDGDGSESYESEEDCFDEGRDDVCMQGVVFPDDVTRDIVYTAEADANSDKLSFCEAGFVLGSIDGDDEGWCLVENFT